MAREDHYDDSRKCKDDDEELGDRKKRHKSSKHSKKRRRDEHRRRREHGDDDESSTSDSRRSSESDKRERKRRKKENKHHRSRDEKKKKKKRKDEKRKRRKEKSADDHDADSSTSSPDPLQRNHTFAEALHDLLQSYPGMASELPIMLIRLAGGTSFDLNQMPDMNASRGLQAVLATLSQYGVEKGDDGSWRWKSPGGGGSQTRNELLLIKIARTLLDQIGVTADAAESFTRNQAAAAKKQVERAQQKLVDLQTKTQTLLEEFGKAKQDGDSVPTLAQELGELCNVILSGESISIDGLPDVSLRNAMEQIFECAGLEKSEMEGEEDSDDGSEEDEGPVMGYGLPDDAGEARANILSIVETCKAHVTSGTRSKHPFRGPAPVPTLNATTAGHAMEDDNDEEDDEGPAPVGSVKAKGRVQRGPTLPPEVVKAMAEKRKRQMEQVTGVASSAPSGEIAEREQWMMEPGEHEFLQGIKSGAPLKNRNFQNTKQSSRVEPAAPVNPAVQAEMDAIMAMHREARGPSLIEQHRQKKAEEKEAAAKKGGKGEWKWSRDQDLDEGRRVDKNALGMVMGGAANELKDKFQGGYSRGFM